MVICLSCSFWPFFAVKPSSVLSLSLSSLTFRDGLLWCGFDQGIDCTREETESVDIQICLTEVRDLRSQRGGRLLGCVFEDKQDRKAVGGNGIHTLTPVTANGAEGQVTFSTSGKLFILSAHDCGDPKLGVWRSPSAPC